MHTLILPLLLLPLVSCGLFPPSGPVKPLTATTFKKAMRANETSLVAFVAPWCGHCQRMTPELTKAATGLSPLIPVYAVDCDDEGNKRLCAEQGVQGFPTVKVFPRGKALPPITYDSGERTAGKLAKFAKLRVPNKVRKLKGLPEEEEEEAEGQVVLKEKKVQAVLVTAASTTKVPLLWKVLANAFGDELSFGVFKGEQEEGSEVRLYLPGETRHVVYPGETKLEPLSAFFKSLIDDPTVLLDLFPAPADSPPSDEPAPSEEPIPAASTASEDAIPSPSDAHDEL